MNNKNERTVEYSNLTDQDLKELKESLLESYKQ